MNHGRTTRVLFFGAVLACAPSFTGGVFGQASQPSLDDLLDLSPQGPTTDQSASESSKPQPGNETLTESVSEALTASDAATAFEQAVREMDSVSRRLGRSLDPGVETQRMQESILRKLDQVIKAAKEQSSSGGGSSSGQPREQDQGGESVAQQGRAQQQGGQPQSGGQQASTGQAGVTTPIKPQTPESAIEQLRKEWGVLPPRVREELSDGLRERFSPLYRRMTEAYYKALAEQE